MFYKGLTTELKKHHFIFMQLSYQIGQTTPNMDSLEMDTDVFVKYPNLSSLKTKIFYISLI